MSKTCATCRFWDAAMHGYGFCRRYPPQAADTHKTFIDPLSIWPKTAARYWCGEHQSRDDAGPQPASEEDASG